MGHKRTLAYICVLNIGRPWQIRDTWQGVYMCMKYATSSIMFISVWRSWGIAVFTLFTLVWGIFLRVEKMVKLITNRCIVKSIAWCGSFGNISTSQRPKDLWGSESMVFDVKMPALMKFGRHWKSNFMASSQYVRYKLFLYINVVVKVKLVSDYSFITM